MTSDDDKHYDDVGGFNLMLLLTYYFIENGEYIFILSLFSFLKFMPPYFSHLLQLHFNLCCTLVIAILLNSVVFNFVC